MLNCFRNAVPFTSNSVPGSETFPHIHFSIRHFSNCCRVGPGAVAPVLGLVCYLQLLNEQFQSSVHHSMVLPSFPIQSLAEITGRVHHNPHGAPPCAQFPPAFRSLAQLPFCCALDKALNMKGKHASSYVLFNSLVIWAAFSTASHNPAHWLDHCTIKDFPPPLTDSHPGPLATLKLRPCPEPSRLSPVIGSANCNSPLHEFPH